MTANTYSQEVRNVADLLKKEMTLGEHGVVEVAEDAFEKTLAGTDLSLDMFKKVQDHRDLVIAGGGLALGELGLAAFKKDEKLDQVSVEMKFHKDSIGGVFHRERSLPDGDGGMKAKHGVLSMSYKANGQVGSKGQLKKVRAHLAEEAKKVLGG